MTPEQKLADVRRRVDRLAMDLAQAQATLEDLQQLLVPADHKRDTVLIDGVPHRFYEGTGWVRT